MGSYTKGFPMLTEPRYPAVDVDVDVDVDLDSDGTALTSLAGALQDAVAQTTPDLLPQALCATLSEHATIGLLDAAQRVGNAERYTRHVLYEHPDGLFTAVALVWRPGQVTPVHGHHTWCAYKIVQGTMHEDRYAWDDATGVAVLRDAVVRPTGDCVGSQAGMQQIHRLRNAGTDTAISIHVYGIDGGRVATHVNRIAALA